MTQAAEPFAIPEDLARVAARANGLPRGPYRIMQPTVARIADDGRVWLMAGIERGWSRFGYPYPSLDALVSEWSVTIGGVGRDRHSVFAIVHPYREPEDDHAAPRPRVRSKPRRTHPPGHTPNRVPRGPSRARGTTSRRG